jgi:V/A-type H+-transporting ATPase subunit B
MTNFCDALKEIAIIMEQVPSNRGYPGDLYSQLALRYEKAVDFEGAGSITILSVTTMPGNDVTHPIPDNTGYTLEKRAMGFRLSRWDEKLLRYGRLFERELMDLSVNIPLLQALDRGWWILGTCFQPEETGLTSQLMDRFWPKTPPGTVADRIASGG